jgi:riboflavin biosynthesis pyrimidine reductase
MGSMATMGTMANFVMGEDGSTSFAGSSKALSSPFDRARFHEIRSKASAILIGGESARNEPYQVTPIPLVIISRSGDIPDSIRANPKAQIWQLDPIAALTKAKSEFGENILIEGGINLLKVYLLENLIDEFYLTISQKSGGESVYDLNSLTRNFTIESSEKVGSDTFLKLLRN